MISLVPRLYAVRSSGCITPALFYNNNITTATAEQSFSALRKIRTYLRSIMSACRLNNGMLLHCHNDIADGIDVTKLS